MSGKIIIGTHDGNMHADELLACYLIKLLPRFENAEIIRSRDKKVLEKCDIVIDVGGEYDHAKKRYDHHQSDFRETMESIVNIFEDVKLSSAGLIWAHYGEEIVFSLSKRRLLFEEVEDSFHHIYKCMIKEIDAKDNGIEQASAPFRYFIRTDLYTRVARLNRASGSEQEKFMKAYDLVGKEFMDLLQDTYDFYIPSRVFVYEALIERFEVDPSGKIIKITESGIYWEDLLRTLEERDNFSTLINFVLFPDVKSGWNVQGVSADGSFTVRAKLLPECVGLSNDDLVAACGVEDAIFVHVNGFIGGAKSYEGALKMAQMSLPIGF